MWNQRQIDWAVSEFEAVTNEVDFKTPVQCNEGSRYLPESVSRFSGYISYDLTPYWREILDCFDPSSPVREVSVMKGVSIAYTTALESLVFYVAGHLRTVPAMFVTADNDLSHERVENNLIPMFQQSGLDVFQSADIGNKQKKGVTAAHLQWKGGGYLIPIGANNANKFRQYSMNWVFMDEIDAWPLSLKRGGNPVLLCKDRSAGFWQVRKIFMGSTPLLKGSSHIETEYLRGDQRQLFLRCLKCGEPQVLRWSGKNKDKGFEFGFKWDYTDKGSLDIASVRYHCAFCNHAHMEHDKTKLLKAENSYWEPTAVPVEPCIRSYKLPSLYSPAGMQPWAKCVAAWLAAWDVQRNKVKDALSLQIFYNNVLAETFEDFSGGKIYFNMVSGHRRSFYRRGEILNKKISECCESGILVLLCTVDVHHNNLAVYVSGVTRGASTWFIDYWRIEDNTENGCENPESLAWGRLRRIIEDYKYIADDKKEYSIGFTMIDASFCTSVIVDFCASYEANVIPIMGREAISKTSAVKEFSDFKTKNGMTGYLINADYYKDRLAPVLRRGWSIEEGTQSPYQFNAPVDATDKELTELTREYKRDKTLTNGSVIKVWYRPHGAENELWDLLVYASAAIDILAYMICIQYFELETVDWDRFWSTLETERLFFRIP